MTRLIFKIVQSGDAWAVEHNGQVSNRSIDKAEAVAAGTKLARAASGLGTPVQVRIDGETGYF